MFLSQHDGNSISKIDHISLPWIFSGNDVCIPYFFNVYYYWICKKSKFFLNSSRQRSFQLLQSYFTTNPEIAFSIDISINRPQSVRYGRDFVFWFIEKLYSKEIDSKYMKYSITMLSQIHMNVSDNQKKISYFILVFTEIL